MIPKSNLSQNSKDKTIVLSSSSEASQPSFSRNDNVNNFAFIDSNESDQRDESIIILSQNLSNVSLIENDSDVIIIEDDSSEKAEFKHQVEQDEKNLSSDLPDLFF